MNDQTYERELHEYDEEYERIAQEAAEEAAREAEKIAEEIPITLENFDPSDYTKEDYERDIEFGRLAMLVATLRVVLPQCSTNALL